MKKADLKIKSTKTNIERVKKDNLISVIVPVYNAEDYLKECLDSLLRQTYSNIEILCVDDGSTDHSKDILNLYQRKDSRVKVFSQENKGPSAARNRALDEAKGDYISFVDSDDYLEANAYEILNECAQQKEDWDLLIFGANLVGGYNDWLNDKVTPVFRQYIDSNPAEVLFTEKCAKPFLWLHFMKRELLEKPYKIRFDEELNLGEDQLFQFNYIPRAKNVMVIDQKLYNYRLSENNSLMQFYNTRRIKKMECHFQIVEKAISDWKKQDYYDTYKDDIWTWVVEFMYWSIIDFPAEFKKEFSQKVLSFMNSNNVDTYLLRGSEVEHYKELVDWAANDTSLEEEVEILTKRIKREQYEIDETLKSRAFKLGKLFTPKKERLELES